MSRYGRPGDLARTGAGGLVGPTGGPPVRHGEARLSSSRLERVPPLTVPVDLLPAAAVAVSPTPLGELSCSRENPTSKAATVAAFRTVTLHTIADAFDLHWQETAIVGYRLDEILSPLLALHPAQVPVAVRREMLDHTYTQALDKRQSRTVSTVPQVGDGRVLNATIEEWAEILLLPVFASYALSPVAESRMHFELLQLLRQLGVGDERNPRPAMYLPTDLRLRLMSRPRRT